MTQVNAVQKMDEMVNAVCGCSKIAQKDYKKRYNNICVNV